jgi:hypothetical protein
MLKILNTNERKNEGLQIVDRRLWIENGSAASSSPFQLSAFNFPLLSPSSLESKLPPLRSGHAIQASLSLRVANAPAAFLNLFPT